MKGVEYNVRLRGLLTPEGTIPMSALIDVSRAILDGSRRALRLLMEGVSVKRGRAPSSLEKPLDFTITGLSKGSTIIQIEAPTFQESAPHIVKQLNLWNMPLTPELKPQDTAISVFSRSVRDAAAGQLESDYYDQGVLESLAPFKTLMREYLKDIQIECPSRPSERFEITESELGKISRIEDETPESKAMVVAGTFNSIEHTHRRFELIMQDAHKIRGIAEPGIDTEDMRNLWGRKVTVKGLAHFKPTGAVRFIEADVIRPFERGEEIFEKISKGRLSPGLIQDIRRGQGIRNPLKEVWGKWPGDESIDEILDTLKKTSKEAI